MSENREYGLCRYCGAKVDLSDFAIERWRTYNRILKRRGEPIMAVDEVAVCAAHMGKWKLDMDAKMWAQVRRDREAERVANNAAGVDELD